MASEPNAGCQPIEPMLREVLRSWHARQQKCLAEWTFDQLLIGMGHLITVFPQNRGRLSFVCVFGEKGADPGIVYPNHHAMIAAGIDLGHHFVLQETEIEDHASLLPVATQGAHASRGNLISMTVQVMAFRLVVRDTVGRIDTDFTRDQMIFLHGFPTALGFTTSSRPFSHCNFKYATIDNNRLACIFFQALSEQAHNYIHALAQVGGAPWIFGWESGFCN